ncbi:hypothetical protein JAAARDRAFT_169261 [Jaapia argillacea MUCL 33604]|uniref:protein-histidine N-methyltransferase n=1 Tax=Jaapia argillacea MUCL 33604 TaxID=933084 RepID=A0A067QBE5_9AGAM|nr:hypothetical protein JAAARDRAFT_169261 [Jaapia argillacea MUCL 33604]
MFKFNFSVDDADVAEDDDTAIPISPNPKSETSIVEDPFREIPLSLLLESLPESISYSPIYIPLSCYPPNQILIARRDLFDARFQIISTDSLVNDSALQYLDAPSDLVPGVYEGGLKTWECSLDIVDYLHSTSLEFRGKRILEVGCGTAIPSLYILTQLFSSPPSEKATEIHLQDYNESVLELVTLPNIILAWYFSPLSHVYKSQHPSTEPHPLISTPSDISLPHTLQSAFLSSLHSHNIQIRFFSGSWSTFHTDRKYDVVLTSETIYRAESLPSLVRLLSDACADVKSADVGVYVDVEMTGSRSNGSLCLVAAKLVYFGVGGGVEEFLKAVGALSSNKGQSVQSDGGKGGKVETVWEKQGGVARKIMHVLWD